MSESNAIPGGGKSSKPDIAANPIYPVAARAALFDLHANLLDLLERGLAPRESPRNIVVVGPGSEALPFSEHLETVSALLNGGNLILLDYSTGFILASYGEALLRYLPLHQLGEHGNEVGFLREREAAPLNRNWIGLAVGHRPDSSVPVTKAPPG
ncbi:MAG: hypothetical protein L0Y43_11210 [Methylococcaceae bacterium]|nr:hypothetical protein [Methylococcaceae bacterium]